MNTSPRTDALRTRVVRTVEELSPQTADLASRAGVSEFYYGHEFLRAYEREPIQPVREVHYIEVLDSADRLLALTPCYVQGDPLRALGLADGELALLSHVWHCSDTQLASTSATPELAGQVVAAMRKVAATAGLARCGFINVPGGTATARALEGTGLTGKSLDTRYTVDLAAMGDWEGYLASLTSKTRREFRRHLRRAEECGVRITDRAPDDYEAPESLRILEVLMENVGSTGYYSKERFSAFLPYTRTGVRIVEVVLDGEILAKAIMFIEAAKIHAWAGGYDKHSDKRKGLTFSSYSCLMAGMLQLGFQAGVATFEGGRRNGAYKERFGMRPKELDAYMFDA
ncbi:GNAT family N-acetyltransferase [Streptomyces sp. N2-109]|uniref:GNAT family N-acetyltransferase n=1 Tax=Streptomyces gossypii TaxID=2883101 RepID=A0ABT2K316_9ACTN|nr:GNAT family N-acetyltransferase [Streptomyces gossypii]MCT2594019.1 GNAT family N-acetyltransferase [Streptomyces gossypii]